MILEVLLAIYALGALATAFIAAFDLGDEVADDEGFSAAFAVVVILAALWPLFFLFFFVHGLWRGVVWLWWGATGG